MFTTHAQYGNLAHVNASTWSYIFCLVMAEQEEDEEDLEHRQVSSAEYNVPKEEVYLVNLSRKKLHSVEYEDATEHRLIVQKLPSILQWTNIKVVYLATIERRSVQIHWHSCHSHFLVPSETLENC